MEPILFTGMHRSGTSLIGRLADAMGLFSGKSKDINEESLFFLQINIWLLDQCGSRWDNPEPIKDLWYVDEALELAERRVRSLFRSPRSISYLGLRNYLHHKSVSSIDMPWGWKDPRNIYTLKFWRRMFPTMKIVFIERHGVDVAASLRDRARKTLTRAQNRPAITTGIVWPFREIPRLLDSPRCYRLEGGLELWAEYQRHAASVIKSLPPDRALCLRYEDLLENPLPHIRALAEFCSLNAGADKLEALTRSIDAGRAYVYRNTPELQDFAQRNRKALEEFRYSV